MNNQIRANQIRLVLPNGDQGGIVALRTALELAAEVGLDLVEVAPGEDPPVCRLMDFGKARYEESVRLRRARQNQARNEVREMKFRPQIDDHDFETKKGHIKRFIDSGTKVRVTVMFRGRQQSRPEMGHRLLARLAEDLADVAIVESSPVQAGRDMSMLLAPR